MKYFKMCMNFPTSISIICVMLFVMWLSTPMLAFIIWEWMFFIIGLMISAKRTK
ncbi:hypothetical protein NCTGTJJY_CDS0155 [Serratia phage 92A1]|nr:hypothetical protein NCTGTJJY_CDS0155 [Serratia phage 92A1]